jgi:hypothetical protein
MKFDHLNIPVSDLARSRGGPQKNFWGYGAELADSDGYLVRLWDERTMREK